MNTPKKGAVRCIIFKEDDTFYGVALEFNIVVDAETYEIATFELHDAIRGYIDSQKKIKGSMGYAPLNQEPDAEYEKLWGLLQSNKPIPSPIRVEHYGVTRI